MSITVLQRKKDYDLVHKRFQEAGISCELSDIRKDNYTETITPLLLDLFQTMIDPVVRLDIGIRLSFSKSPDVEKALLKAFFEGVPSSVMAHDSFRWGVGSLLEAVSSKKHRMHVLI